ncbi:MAG: histone deacetylase [Acidimicrobiales bacterium]
MTLLVATHPRFAEHDTGAGHPERPARLRAVERGIADAGLAEAIRLVEAAPAPRAAVERVHPEALVSALERFCRAGGGYLDPDTHVGPASFEAALLAAGAGLDLVARLDRGEGEAGFCAVRPPGHHATATRSMGFCLFNNVAVTAAALADRGERVVVVDYDAHHGNGTQDVFYDDPRVFYVSLHEWPLYPGTGALRDTGRDEGIGTTLNFPLPAGATGDVYRRAIEDVVLPAMAGFAPTWLLISAGFDAHRADPLTGLALTAGDYADITADLLVLAPPGRRLLFLEGGYDLDGLAASCGAALATVVDASYRPERPSTGGPGSEVVAAAALGRQATPPALRP